MTKSKRTEPQPAMSPAQTFDLPLFMSTDLAATTFSVAVATLRRYHRKGLLPATRAQVGSRGGKLLFRRDDLLALFGLTADA